MVATRTPTTLCDTCQHKLVPNKQCIHHPPISVDALRSGRVYSDAEREETAAILELERDELRRYDEELDRLHRIVEKLEVERNVLRRNIASRENYISPIRRVPFEVWEKVFLEVAYSTSGYSLQISAVGRKKSKVIAHPVALSHVCSHWRSMLRFMPSVWSTISVNLHELELNIIPTLDLFLDNSKGRSLKIELKDCQASGDEDWREFQYNEVVFWHVMKQMGRCEELIIDLRNWEVLGCYDWKSHYLPSFSTLRTLRDNSFQEDAGDSEDGVIHLSDSHKWFWKAIHRAPNLENIVSQQPLGADMIRYNQLRSVHFETISLKIPAFFDILSSCLSVQSCTLRRFLDPFSTGGQMINLPNLQEFHVLVGPGLSTVLDSITLSSSLAHLGLDCRLRENGWCIDPLSRLLQRSGSQLRTLSLTILTGELVDEAFISGLIKRIPSLLHLEVVFEQRDWQYYVRNGDDERAVSSGAITLRLLSDLTLLLDDPPLCPRLQSLYISLQCSALSAREIAAVSKGREQLVKSRRGTSGQDIGILHACISFNRKPFPWSCKLDLAPKLQ
ncbi:hypothetical protein VNI00_000926 [Paramarasmius palmivorus]|uniref:F-box domain-containing protein n=1 Tax=Paramarasmius palmivorus TaxID=297713 RepID=A0AAW0E6E4_9AGAR